MDAVHWLNKRRVKFGALALFYSLIALAVAAGDDPNLVFRGLTFAAATLAWTFVLLYGLRSPWRLTVVGRSLMYVWLSLTGVLTLVVLSYWLGAYPGRDYVRAGVYSTLIPAFGSFIQVLLEQQDRRNRGEAPAVIDAQLAEEDA